jgi:hypothetical protein
LPEPQPAVPGLPGELVLHDRERPDVVHRGPPVVELHPAIRHVPLLHVPSEVLDQLVPVHLPVEHHVVWFERQDRPDVLHSELQLLEDEVEPPAELEAVGGQLEPDDPAVLRDRRRDAVLLEQRHGAVLLRVCEGRVELGGGAEVGHLLLADAVERALLVHPPRRGGVVVGDDGVHELVRGVLVPALGLGARHAGEGVDVALRDGLLEPALRVLELAALQHDAPELVQGELFLPGELRGLAEPLEQHDRRVGPRVMLHGHVREEVVERQRRVPRGVEPVLALRGAELQLSTPRPGWRGISGAPGGRPGGRRPRGGWRPLRGRGRRGRARRPRRAPWRPAGRRTRT